MFTMKEIAEALGRKPGDHELHLTAEIYDWFLQLNETGYSSCVIHERVIKMVLLGDKSRTFKPGFPQTVYVSLDGSFYNFLLADMARPTWYCPTWKDCHVLLPLVPILKLGCGILLRQT